jgi:MFS family permease
MNKLYGYLVWLIATFFVVYSFSLNTAAAVFSEPIKSALAASNLGISIAMSAFILGFACMQIPAGYLLDRFNPRYIVSSGIFILAVGNVVASYSDNLTLFTLSNLIQGVGASFAFISAAVLISQWFSGASFPILFGLTQAMSCILSGVLHYVFSLELATHSWNDLYRYLALFGFSLFVLSLLLIKSPPHYRQELTPSLSHSIALVFKNKNIVLCAIAAATSFGILLAYAGLWYLKIQVFYDLDSLEAVFISSMIFFGIGVGSPFLGWVSNKLRSRVMVIHVTLCLGTMFLIMGIYLPHYYFNSLILIKTVSFFVGFFLSGAMLFYTIVNESASPATRGVAISVLNTCVFLLNTLMMFIPSWFLTQYSPKFFTYLWTLPFIVLIALLLLYFIKDRFSVS